MREAKRLGFSDRQIGALSDIDPERVRNLRRQWGIRPVYKMVDTCAAEFEAATPYYYSTYEEENEAPPLDGARSLWWWGAGQYVSAKASSSTTAVCMQLGRCRNRA